MKLWVGFGSAIAATSIIRNHRELLNFFDSQLVDLCSTKGKKKKASIFVQCEVRPLGNTAYSLHAPIMSDKGLNLLLHSCWDLGLLYWQPADFSACKTAEDQEGTWAVKIAQAGQWRGLQLRRLRWGWICTTGGLALCD